ncbi:DUF3575 domain-containing protein [Hymenobacter metallicola]|uniref:DUF3575 domain-containing protein n=1 Tax=Hymenobacter metallicola TaxID=2563114 RepID=A0A4Z0Q9L5_9BACT|nr:DUF3575 domain-containing protein [Hymenobacter metallicola]TGE26415.1 DUF3575 domain-containing protein [Hymenobacter metallicola]
MPFCRLVRTFLPLLAGMLSSLALQAQPSPGPAGPVPPKNLLKIAPFGWIHGQLPFSVESRLGYERVIGPHSSLGASYSYLGTNYPFSFLGSVALSSAISTAFTAAGHPTVVWTETKIRTKGHRYQFQYRHYLSKKYYAPEGWYLSPHYSHAQAEYRVTLKDFDVARTLKTTNSNYNLLFGYQNVLGRHFVLDVFTGLGYRDIQTKIFDENGGYLHDMEEGSALKISSGLNIGWAF